MNVKLLSTDGSIRVASTWFSASLTITSGTEDRLSAEHPDRDCNHGVLRFDDNGRVP